VGYLPDGRIDSTFGNAGVATIALASAQLAQLVALEDDRMLVVGSGGSNWFLAARLLPTGVLDPSFGSGGVVVIQRGTGTTRARAAWAQSDGRVVLAGYMAPEFGSDWDFAVARLLPSGAMDPSFGDNGWTTTSFGERDQGAAAIGVLPGGRIVAVGSTHDGFQTDFALAGYLPESVTSTEPHSPTEPQASHELSLVRPNPLDADAGFTLFVASAQDIAVELFDALGRRVASLYEGRLVAGETRSFTIRGGALAAGVYALRVRGEAFSDVRKVTVVR
jgi:uncharacterized delta-60 repeat protein